MAKSPPSNATPSMLKWARKTHGLTVEAVAGAERISPDTLRDWEAGRGTPSFSRLRRLATRYKRPLMVFYLQEPPKAFSVVKDFRTLFGRKRDEFTPELRYVLRLAQERQAWAASYLEAEAFPEIDFVGSVKRTDEVESVAKNLRSRLNVSIDEQTACLGSAEAYRLWRQKCEDIGVFVFQSHKVAVDEMRGCALTDEHAPVIVVNGQDSFVARAFTLIHEMVHILLGESGVTGAGPYVYAPRPDRAIERFCNHVAAETIVPKTDFVQCVPSNWKTRDDDVISNAAKLYRTSRAVIVLRLVETGFASSQYLNSKWPALQAVPKEKPVQEGGPPRHRLVLARTGESFAKLAITAFHDGTIHGGQLASLMDMKLTHLPKVERIVFPGRVQPAIA